MGNALLRTAEEKLKYETIFQKKWCCLAILSFYVRYVVGKATFSPAKKLSTLKLMISTNVRSLLFVKMEKDTLVLNHYAIYLMLYHQWTRMPIKNYYCVLKRHMETAELSMKTAADEVRNLLLIKRMILLMKMIVQQMKMPTLMQMVVILMRVALLLLNLLLTLLFWVTARGKRGGKIL